MVIEIPETVSMVTAIIFFAVGILCGWLVFRPLKTLYHTIGVIHIYENEDDDKDRYLFEFSEDPSEIPRKKVVSFDVKIEHRDSQKIQPTE